MKRVASGFLVTIVAGFLVLPATAQAQTTVTSFAPSTNALPGVWFENDVRYGGTASVAELFGIGGNLETNQPLPIGAAKITTRLNENDDKAEVGVGDNYGAPGAIFSTIQIGYSWHKATNGTQNLNAAPSIKLTIVNAVCDETPIVSPATLADCFGTLVYEPYQNDFGNFPALDTWFRSDLDHDTGMWWWTGGFGQPSGGGGCNPCRTLEDWLSVMTPDFDDAVVFQVSVGVGSSNQGQIGFFDKVTIAGTNADASYDFDPALTFETLGECVSTLIADNCSDLVSRERATCNHEQQMACYDILGIE